MMSKNIGLIVYSFPELDVKIKYRYILEESSLIKGERGMKKILFSMLVLLVAAIGSLLTTGQASAQTFKDVPSKAAYYNAVEELVKLGAISAGNENYNPTNHITRGQAAKMIAISLGLYDENAKLPTTSQFKDVPVTHSFYPYIVALSERHIMNGRSDGTFGVNDSLTRGQIAKILVNALDIEPFNPEYIPYEDVIPGEGFSDYIGTLSAYDLLNIDSDNFYPGAPVKRSDLALYIYRAVTNSKSIKSSGILDIKTLVKPFNSDEELYYLGYVSYENDVLRTSYSNDENEYLLTPLKAGESYLFFSYYKFVEDDFAKPILTDISKNMVIRVTVTDNGDEFAMKYERVYEIPEEHKHKAQYEDMMGFEEPYYVSLIAPNGEKQMLRMDGNTSYSFNLEMDGLYQINIHANEDGYEEIVGRKAVWYGYDLDYYELYKDITFYYDVNNRYELTVDQSVDAIRDEGNGIYRVNISKPGIYKFTRTYKDGSQQQDTYAVMELDGQLYMSNTDWNY